MSAAGGELPATRQPGEEPWTAGAGGSGWGAPCTPSSTPQPRGSPTAGAPQPPALSAGKKPLEKTSRVFCQLVGAGA